MEWLLPPDLAWPRFLRLLRHPAPPEGWLEAAADLPDMCKRPLLLRWIAQHPKSPAHLRMRLLGRLPWRMLAAIAQDASAHPQARSHSAERLQGLWTSLTLGERRSLASHAPRPMWETVWRVRDTGVLAAFLAHPKLGMEALCALIQPPLSPFQATALQQSRWRESAMVAEQVLVSLDQSLSLPESGLVLGMAAPWIRVLSMEECLNASNRMTHPALRRMARAWAIPRDEDGFAIPAESPDTP